ncbi:hypothetical protein Tco_1504636 [Tanacetum coccineum]
MYIMTSRPRTRVFRPGPVWGCDRLVSRAKVIENQVMAAPVISILSDTSEESVADPIVTPEVGTVSVVSPAGVLDLVDYSPSSDSDPSEDSLPPAPDLPLVSPFLCSDDTEADGESEPAEQRPVSSSHDTLAPLSEFPLAPVVAPPEIHSSPSSALSDHSLSGLTPPETTDADSSTPQRFFYRSLVRTPRHSSSSERSLDSSPPSSRISRKRCRSPTALVPSSTHVSRSIAPTPANFLPPRKRFRDSYSSEDSKEEHMEVDTADAEAVADVGISAADTREIVVDPLVIGDSFESFRGGIPDLEDTIYDIVHYMLEVRIDRITEIKTTQRQLKTSQMVASGERASLVERIGSLRLEYLKVRGMLSIEREIGLTVIVGRWHFHRRSFFRFVGIVMILGGDLGGWSHMLRDIWVFALRLAVP